MCKIRNSIFYGITIDESTDISITSDLVVFATIIEEGVHVIFFLGLLKIEGEKLDVNVIFYCLINHLKKWELDLGKFVAFGSDGTSIMMCSRSGVATKLKIKINPFLLFFHCVAYRNNLAALDASKVPNCKVISSEVDTLLNIIASFFNISSKCKHALTTLQEELFDAKRTMKRYHKI